jgi:hypothetical protein
VVAAGGGNLLFAYELQRQPVAASRRTISVATQIGVTAIEIALLVSADRRIDAHICREPVVTRCNPVAAPGGPDVPMRGCCSVRDR